MGIRIGFIGAGIIANRHFGNLMGFDDVEIAAVADVAIERAKDLAARAGGRAFSDYNQMLDSVALDAVYICIPPFAHGAPERAVIAHDLPFFVEKPVAAEWETAEQIGREVEARGLVTATGYHWRYLDTTERAQELLSKNPARLALGYWMDFTPPPTWWTKQALSGGQMVEQTTHIFDLARVLVGEVTKVYGAAERTERPAFPEADICDVSLATLHFKSGALGNLASTCLLNWPHRIGLHVFSEGMAIEMTEFELMVDVGQGRPLQKAQGDPFVREDRDFVDAVKGLPSKIRAPYREALRTHYVVTMAARSAREGRVLELEPEKSYAEAGTHLKSRREG